LKERVTSLEELQQQSLNDSQNRIQQLEGKLKGETQLSQRKASFLVTRTSPKSRDNNSNNNYKEETEEEPKPLTFLEYIQKIIALGRDLLQNIKDDFAHLTKKSDGTISTPEQKNFHIFRFYHKLDELVQAIAEIVGYILPSFRREMVKIARTMLTNGCIFICARERG
jgi:hypothetical protein